LFVLNKTVKELGSGFTSSQNNTILKIRGIKKEKLKLKGSSLAMQQNTCHIDYVNRVKKGSHFY